jgi:hypothetical protein
MKQREKKIITKYQIFELQRERYWASQEAETDYEVRRVLVDVMVPYADGEVISAFDPCDSIEEAQAQLLKLAPMHTPFLILPVYYVHDDEVVDDA